MIRTGPDGGLWIADFYRYVIEHPEWIPEHQQRKVDLRAGSDRGRIYRIVPDKGARSIPKLNELNTEKISKSSQISQRHAAGHGPSTHDLEERSNIGN